MDTSVRSTRRPFFRVFKDMSGNERVLSSRPPRKLHEALPQDKVELNVQRNDSFEEGGVYTVKHISSRSPNILQIENDDGETTFVPYFELKLDEAIAPRDGVAPKESRQANKYLRWP